jgi:hypothetical protein
MFMDPWKRAIASRMDREPTPQPESLATPRVVDLTDVDAQEVAQRGQDVIDLSRELNSSSKALLEQIDPT